MYRNDSDNSALVPDPRRRDRPPQRWASDAKCSGYPHPAEARLEKPAPIVVREPAPRLIARERPAKNGIEEPAAIVERRPAESRAIRPPTVPIAGHRKPRAIRVQVIEARVIGTDAVLQTGVRALGKRIDSAGNPFVKIIQVPALGDGRRKRIAGLHGERLAFREGRRAVFLQD